MGRWLNTKRLQIASSRKCKQNKTKKTHLKKEIDTSKFNSKQNYSVVGTYSKMSLAFEASPKKRQTNKVMIFGSFTGATNVFKI